jgi:signal transduction histidine kinase
MNHEFRTPLTSILTFSELIRDNPEVADRFADRILGGGRRLLHTLNTVMDFAELEGGGRSVTPGTFHLGDVVRSVADDFRENARQKELDLSVEIGEEIGTVVLDRHRVERILTHLLHNAVKFTEDGSITVTAGLGTDRADGPVELCVADTGVGIDPDRQPEIFEEFAQASRGLDRTHEGNGLGLTIVQRLVDQLDGALDLESTPGEGTRVTVRLPIDGDLD